jgi:hypothetical protein
MDTRTIDISLHVIIAIYSPLSSVFPPIPLLSFSISVHRNLFFSAVYVTPVSVWVMRRDGVGKQSAEMRQFSLRFKNIIIQFAGLTCFSSNGSKWNLPCGFSSFIDSLSSVRVGPSITLRYKIIPIRVNVFGKNKILRPFRRQPRSARPVLTAAVCSVKELRYPHICIHFYKRSMCL